MVWTECSRRTFSMHEKLAAVATIGLVGFNLAGVVGYIEQQIEVGIGEKVRENAPCVMPDDLAIGEGTIDGGTHCADQGQCWPALSRRAGELAVGKRYA